MLYLSTPVIMGRFCFAAPMTNSVQTASATPFLVGEWFPVKRKLLRPCIALTKAVRSEDEAEVDVSVDVDTDIFDRQACDVKELLSRPVHPPTLAGGPIGACGRM